MPESSESTKSRKRRTAKDWSRILQRQQASGLSRTEFCRREAIALSSFDRWRQRVDPEATRTSFVELVPATPTIREKSWSLEIELPNGVELRFRG